MRRVLRVAKPRAPRPAPGGTLVFQTLAAFLPRLSDPYLADALWEFLRLAAQLDKHTAAAVQTEEVVRDAFYLCEVTRDATMRFIPYSADHNRVLVAARDAYTAVVGTLRAAAITGGPKKKVKLYADHIENRIKEYTAALDGIPE